MFFKGLLIVFVMFLFMGILLPALISSTDTLLTGFGIFIILCFFSGIAIYLDKVIKDRRKSDEN